MDMKQIYIDDDFKCHTSKLEGTKEAETDFFDGKCNEYIEGYRFVPSGENWTREDGVVFQGEMIAPWKNFDELDTVQRDYERERLADAEKALAILLGGEV